MATLLLVLIVFVALPVLVGHMIYAGSDDPEALPHALNHTELDDPLYFG